MKILRNRKIKRNPFLTLSVLTAVLASVFTLQAGAKVIKPESISAIGTKAVTMTVGDERDLKVSMSPVRAEDDYLDWEIVSGSKVVAFTDYDRNDDEVEIRALKAGTAKVRCFIDISGKKNKEVIFTVTVKKTSNKSAITRVGEAKRTVYVGDDFELKVKKSSGLKDRYLEWTIKDEKILRFEDYDETTGDDVDFLAKKDGTTTVTCTNTLTNKKVSFTVTVKEPETTITRNGPKVRMAELGDDFDLEVDKKSNNVKDRNLKWTISDKGIADFNDRETWGDEVEFLAKKAGTVTITCKDSASGDKVTFTVNVVPGYDDDYDDDDD